MKQKCPECKGERRVENGQRKVSLEAIFGGCNACHEWVEERANR